MADDNQQVSGDIGTAVFVSTEGPMKASRVSRDELRQAARTAGYADLGGVQAIVVERLHRQRLK